MNYFGNVTLPLNYDIRKRESFSCIAQINQHQAAKITFTVYIKFYTGIPKNLDLHAPFTSVLICCAFV